MKRRKKEGRSDFAIVCPSTVRGERWTPVITQTLYNTAAWSGAIVRTECRLYDQQRWMMTSHAPTVTLSISGPMTRAVRSLEMCPCHNSPISIRRWCSTGHQIEYRDISTISIFYEKVKICVVQPNALKRNKFVACWLAFCFFWSTLDAGY